MEEYKKAKDWILLIKASDCDNSPGSHQEISNILNLANSSLINLDKLAQWSISNIIPVSKEGDFSKAGNYRGISLNAITAELTIVLSYLIEFNLHSISISNPTRMVSDPVPLHKHKSLLLEGWLKALKLDISPLLFFFLISEKFLTALIVIKWWKS